MNMSQLPADVHAALAQLSAALSSSDNNVRSQAEEHLTNDWVVNRPDVLLMGLVEQMHGSQDTTVWQN
jgi:importin-5